MPEKSNDKIYSKQFAKIMECCNRMRKYGLSGDVFITFKDGEITKVKKSELVDLSTTK